MIAARVLFTFSSREHFFVRQCSAALPMRDTKPKSRHARPSFFVDWKRVKVIGGVGGDGCISFMRLFCNPNAGPDGGDGGNGGHIIFEATSNVTSLEHIQSTIYGNAGLRGFGKDMHGRCGEHKIVPVPLGTVVCNEEERSLADLDLEGSRFLAARGGAGGRGNHHFLTNENRHPRVCQMGGLGETIVYHLEMKTMAQAGLVGFPNVGKSTLLRAISRARPKVASYPFTTLRPHVGVVSYDDYLQLAVADLPGLVEGAHQNRGLGHAFLRHTERCGCLLFVVDLECPDPAGQYSVLLAELELYRQGFTDGHHAVVANKVDVRGALDRLEMLRERIDGRYPLFPVSAKFGTNLLSVLKHIRNAYDATVEEKNKFS